MPSTFIFGCLDIKRRSCEIPFPKGIVYSDAVFDDKLGQGDNLSCQAKTPKVKP